MLIIKYQTNKQNKSCDWLHVPALDRPWILVLFYLKKSRHIEFCKADRIT